jgi:hypothetical protein
MVDNREPPRNTPDTDRQATLREWARKHYLRDPQSSDKGADRASNQERKSRSGKSRDDGDYER